MTIVVSPLAGARACFQRKTPTHVVSLLSPGMAPPAWPRRDLARLHLVFNDIVTPREGLILPAREHMNAFLQFLEGWDRRSALMIHCWAGVSRSTAAAYVAACLRDGPGCEDTLAQNLRAAAPFATPNARLVALADEALQRDGRMTAAILAIGRGAETTTGAVFEI